MLNQDILKEFLFDCQMRKLSERTIKSYKNNNLKMLHFICSEYGITELVETNHMQNVAISNFLLIMDCLKYISTA